MSRKQQQASLAGGRKDVVLTQDSPFAVAEAYKAARTNIMFKLTEKGKNSLVFTSAYLAEGKTTTCVNLAITFSQTGSKVLVIDADLRKPRVHRLLNVPLAPGLSDTLAGMADGSCIKQTSFENLYVLSAGTIPPNPAELLTSDTMTKLLESACETFDYVFIDTPPVGLVTDASVLAAKTTGALLVARQGYSTKDGIKSAIEALESSGANIIGFIFNDVDVEKTAYRYGRRYGSRYGYKYGYKYGGYGYGYGYGGYGYGSKSKSGSAQNQAKGE